MVVVGAGLAGLQSARLLGRSGLRVLLVDQKRSVAERVHTTGIFVRRTLEDFDLPEDCLGTAVRHVSLYSPSQRRMDLESLFDEFRVGRMAKLYLRLLQEATDSGVEWRPENRFTGLLSLDEGVRITFECADGIRTIDTRFVIGADGVLSPVARSLGLTLNREWIVGVEDVYRGVAFSGEPRFHCFLDPRIAPGYLAWVVNDGQEAHVGVGGYANRFRPIEALELFKRRLGGIIELETTKHVERRGGRIPVGGVLPRIANRYGLLVGDAAGAVSPLTAGGLDPCLRLSTVAAEVTAEYLRTGDADSLAQYDGRRFRNRFSSRLWLRKGLNLLAHPLALEAAFSALSAPPLKPLAWKVFFGRGSFPDVSTSRIGASLSH